MYYHFCFSEPIRSQNKREDEIPSSASKSAAKNSKVKKLIKDTSTTPANKEDETLEKDLKMEGEAGGAGAKVAENATTVATAIAAAGNSSKVDDKVTTASIEVPEGSDQVNADVKGTVHRF